MREIKYRGLVIEPLVSGEKWISLDEEYHEVYINRAEKTAYINGHEVVYESVCEYTGLNDKNGVEIYEGDILNIQNGVGGEYFKALVRWLDSGFCLAMPEARNTIISETIPWYIRRNGEVIGNIHENPDLLEVAK